MNNVVAPIQMDVVAPDFSVYNHQNCLYRLANVMGEAGALLLFSGDVWQISTVRYALWLQRQSYNLALSNISAAMIFPNHPYDLGSLVMTIPAEISFLLLTDPERDVYTAYDIVRPTLVLVDRERVIRKTWFVDNGELLDIRDVVRQLAS